MSIFTICCQNDENVYLICWCFFYLHVFSEVAARWALSATVVLTSGLVSREDVWPIEDWCFTAWPVSWIIIIKKNAIYECCSVWRNVACLKSSVSWSPLKYLLHLCGFMLSTGNDPCAKHLLHSKLHTLWVGGTLKQVRIVQPFAVHSLGINRFKIKVCLYTKCVLCQCIMYCICKYTNTCMY